MILNKLTNDDINFFVDYMTKKGYFTIETNYSPLEKGYEHLKYSLVFKIEDNLDDFIIELCYKDFYPYSHEQDIFDTFLSYVPLIFKKGFKFIYCYDIFEKTGFFESLEA